MYKKTIFNVLEYDFNSKKSKPYDVLPYFRDTWRRKRVSNKKNVKDKKTLKEWIKDASMYMFWARCEYEFLMCPWPYREKTLLNDLYKIDVHEQIMMNIDVITNILYEEFKIKKSVTKK